MRQTDSGENRTTASAWAAWGVYLLMRAVVNAESVLSETARRGGYLPRWEPWTWELSSVFCTFCLTALVALACRSFPIERPHVFRNALLHVPFSVVFSLMHVLGMVGLRKVVYASVGRHYDFGSWPTELVYEYRKDFIGYILILVGIHVLRRWQSPQAGGVRDDRSELKDRYAVRLLVPVNFREQLVPVEQIAWLEADGNHVKLHTQQGTLRPRMTLTTLEAQLDPSRFARVHRSHIINLDQVKEIQPWFHGDFRVVLHSGETVPLSRRFRDRIRSR